MKIMTFARRKGGSFHSIDKQEYHFAPVDPNGPHVCEVTNPKHAQRFLSIPAFAIYDPDAPAEPPKPEPAQKPIEQTAQAHDEPEGEADGDAVKPLEDAPDEVLDTLYQDAYGKKPHHKCSRAKIIEMIRKAPAKEAE